MKTVSPPNTGKPKAGNVSQIVAQHIAAPGSGIPGGWSVRYPWTNGIIKAEGGPEEVVDLIAKTLRANGENANTDEIARWCLFNVWLKRAGETRWKGKFQLSGDSAKLQKAAKPEKLTPREYGHVLWGLANLMMAMPPKERPLKMNEWFHITREIIRSESAGCDECLNHTSQFMEQFPLMANFTDEQLRVWLWLFHDAANKNAGQSRQSYARVAKHWMWPALTDAEFETIRKSL